MAIVGLRLAALLLIVFQVNNCRSSTPSSATVARKAPQESVTLAWDYPGDNEARIHGFLLKRSSWPEGPYQPVCKVAADQRAITFQIDYEPGKTSAYYVVVALEGNKESAATNVVEFQKE